jgi:hypothetical protein
VIHAAHARTGALSRIVSECANDSGTLALVSLSVRRAPRFEVALWVQVTGIDDEPVLRRGDLSASGLFLQLDYHVGDVGSIQRLVLREQDDTLGLVVLARLVRVASIEDLWKGRLITGAAFQFLFAEEPELDGKQLSGAPLAEAKSIQRLLRKVVEPNSPDAGVELTSWRGPANGSGEPQTGTREVNLRSMALETDYSLREGETIRVEMPAHGLHDRVSFDGHVVDCEPLPGANDSMRFRVVVRFGNTPANDIIPEASGENMDEAFDALLEVLTSGSSSSAQPAKHLAGNLSRISLGSVLTLCQIERVTGVLRLLHGTSVILAFLRAGDVVDATIEGREVPPRVALREVLGWRDGTFEVVFEPVEREDRVAMSTTALLLDLAREEDELQFQPRRAEGT